MINIRSSEEIALLREAGRLVGQAHELAKELLVPGVRGETVDREVETFICDNGGRPAFKGFQGFPASVCFSLNDEVVHGMRVLQPQ